MREGEAIEEEAVMNRGGPRCRRRQLLRGGSPIALSYLDLSLLVLTVKLNDVEDQRLYHCEPIDLFI